MPKTLNKFDFDAARKRSGAGRSPVYDWDSLLDGKVKLLVQGEDFNFARGENKPTNERAHNFVGTVRGECQRRLPDHKVKAAVVNGDAEPDADNGTNVVIQAVKMDPDEIQKREESNRQRRETIRKNKQKKEQEERQTAGANA